MFFIASLGIVVVAVILWRFARNKVRQNNIAFRPAVTVSALAAGAFAILAVLECFTQIRAGHFGAGKDGLPIILDTK